MVSPNKLHLLGVPSSAHYQQKGWGSDSSASSQPGAQAGVSGELAASKQGEGLLKGSFLYSDTLNVYPLESDAFGEGGL